MIKINLIPRAISRKKQRERKEVALLALMFVVLLIIIVLVHTTVQSKLTETTAKLAKAEEDIKSAELVLEEIKNVETIKRDLNKKIDVIDNLNKRKTGPVKVLDELTALIPDQLHIQSFSETGGKVEISGSSIDNETIAKFLDSLMASKFYKNIELIQSTKAETADKKLQIQNFNVKGEIAYSGEFEAPKAEEKKEDKKAEKK